MARSVTELSGSSGGSGSHAEPGAFASEDRSLAVTLGESMGVRASPATVPSPSLQKHRKPTRTLSGVAIVAVMTSPARCPHGRCTYCPGGLEAGTPQSYTGEEPSALRGAQFGWDARQITEHRLAALEAIGHPTSKVEVIVMGGTFPARPKAYRDGVFRGVFDGLNGRPSSSLPDAQAANESSDRRLVSLTVETRPDHCDGSILPDLLDAGVTRVEIGVECLTESVLRDVNRAHDVGDVERSTREAKDRGLKVAYHVMLGLPGMNPELDLRDVRRMFEAPEFRPDMLKIYPTLVLPGTRLHEDWTAGRYRPYDTETAAGLLARIKALVPPWVRIQRIQRDIPARLIADGVRTSNLRQVALRRLAETGGRCRCLRCREPGRGSTPDPEDFEERETRYAASDGNELFLSVEDPATDTVGAFLRLRFPSDRTEGGLESPVIRELKVLGSAVPVGTPARRPTDYQHRGFGKALLRRAESAVRSEGYDRLYVRTAVGTRGYYRALGFEREGSAMVKPLFA
ncbi:MAG: tRNA uridine(34) 5-carboxymethylaminomethyl modification radical SAM/GNAT enzyme Elp3 [Thermoplasmata archaeon]|nr:tRNA uridine(34) 5-carboxymethylaminomethyl modification radical SAM/GNAT enzyme Elp3 [Thermoplasmata archaeon]